jgi:hypothetical protein
MIKFWFNKVVLGLEVECLESKEMVGGPQGLFLSPLKQEK